MTGHTSISVDRDVDIHARPETVFGFFTDADRLSAWFGPGSTVEPQVGGRIAVRFPGGAAVAEGEILELEPPRRIVFTWGYRDNEELPPGGSRVEVDLTPTGAGTHLRLRHVVSSDRLREAHLAGWRHHLSHLATVSARDGHADAAQVIDRWHRTWTFDEDAGRRAHLGAIAHDDVAFTDDLAAVRGIDEVVAHVGNARRHLDGAVPERVGPARLVGDRVLADWVLRSAGGDVVTEGRLVAEVDLDSRLRSVISAWSDEPDVVATRLLGGESGSEPSAAAAPPIEPHLWAEDLPAAVAWYREVLGFDEDARYPAGDDPTWYRLCRGEVALMIARVPDDAQARDGQAYLRAVRDRTDHGGPLALYLRVADVDGAHRRASAGGATVLEEVWDPWWGGRQFTVEGPDGVWWTVHAGSGD